MQGGLFMNQPEEIISDWNIWEQIFGISNPPFQSSFKREGGGWGGIYSSLHNMSTNKGSKLNRHGG